MKNLVRVFRTLVIACVVMPAPTRGDEVLVSNLDQLWTHGGIGEFHGVFAGATWEPFPATLFHTGPVPYQLTSVRAEHAIAGVPPISSSLHFVVHKWTTPLPPWPESPALAELDLVGVSSTPTHYPGTTQYADYSPLAPIVLEANSNYLIGAFVRGSPDGTLMFIDSFDETGLPGWSFLDFGPGGSVDEAGTIQWTVFGGHGSQVMKLELRGIAVPEPSALTLGAGGLVTLVLPGMVRGSRLFRRQRNCSP